MNIDSRLDPCPFCGSGAALENVSKPNHERHITAGCSNEECFAYLPSVYFAREADAIAAWNRRAALPSEKTEPVAELHRKEGLGPFVRYLPAAWKLGPGYFPLYASPSPAGMKVKALEWLESGNGWTALTPWGQYAVWPMGGKFRVVSEPGHTPEFGGRYFSDPNVAKAAVQVKHEARILSTIDPGEPK